MGGSDGGLRPGCPAAQLTADDREPGIPSGPGRARWRGDKLSRSCGGDDGDSWLSEEGVVQRFGDIELAEE